VYDKWAKDELNGIGGDADGIRDSLNVGRDAAALGLSELEKKAIDKARTDAAERARNAARALPCRPTAADAEKVLSAADTAVRTGNDEGDPSNRSSIIGVVQATAEAVVRATAQQPSLSASARADLANAALKASRPDLAESIKKGEKVAPPKCAASADIYYELGNEFGTGIDKLHAWSCDGVEDHWQATVNSDLIADGEHDPGSAHLSWEFTSDRHQASFAFSDVHNGRDWAYHASGAQVELLATGSGWMLRFDDLETDHHVDSPISMTLSAAECG